MLDTPAFEIVLVILTAIIAATLGWFFRGTHTRKQKLALGAGWQQRVEAQQSENDRLQSQTTSLMRQVNQYQAAGKDVRMRMKELSESLREALERRDKLQRQLKEIRSKLDLATVERDSLRTNARSRNTEQQTVADSLKDKDIQITRLRQKLANWHSRVPPLMEHCRARDLKARELEAELGQARSRIETLERRSDSDDTRIEPMDTVPVSLDASNDQYEETSRHDMSGFDDYSSDPAGSTTDSGDHTSVGNRDGVAKDDLKRIKGVGPAIEKTLNELGIYRFDQIINLSDHDIARIAKRLRGFISRIQREDWVGQARLLHFERNDHPA